MLYKDLFISSSFNTSLNTTSRSESSVSWLNLKSLSPLSNSTSCFSRRRRGGWPGRDLFPPGLSRQQHGMAGAGGVKGGQEEQDFATIAPPILITSDAHTHSVGYSSPVSCDRGSPSPMCNKISFYLHLTRWEEVESEGGRALGGLNWPAVIQTCRGFDSITEGGCGTEPSDDDGSQCVSCYK